MEDMYEVTERLWLTADAKVVKDGDPAAAELLAGGPGDQIPMEQAKALGLVGSSKPASEPDPESAPKPKAAAKSRRKAKSGKKS